MRNHYWDWLRLGSLVLMFVEHLRFVWPENFGGWSWVAGRIVFPIFGVIAAVNFLSAEDSVAYLKRLLPLALIAEPAFYVLTGNFGNMVLQLWLGFSFVWWGNPLFAAACAFCDYGTLGLAAIVIWCAAGKSWRLAGGLVANALPFGWISGIGSVLPGLPIKCPAVPFRLHNFFGTFYVGHLYLLAGLKLWTQAT